MNVAAPGTLLLRAEDLMIRFGGLVALKDFRIEVPAAGLVGLIGPNGAGKTTVFNLLTGVYRPTAGRVYLEERELTGRGAMEISRSGVARTFQNIRLFSGMSALDNLLAAATVQRKGSSLAAVLHLPGERAHFEVLKKKAMEWLDFVGLASVAGLPATSLPYGDQRKLEIARALMTDPQVLLLDEPAAGMNPTEKENLRELVRRIAGFGIGVLLIEHDMKFVMNLCSRITVLDHGETICVGVPAEVQADHKVIEAYLGVDAEEGA